MSASVSAVGGAEHHHHHHHEASEATAAPSFDAQPADSASGTGNPEEQALLALEQLMSGAGASSNAPSNQTQGPAAA